MPSGLRRRGPRPPKIKAVTNDPSAGVEESSPVPVAMTTTMMMTTSTTAAATSTMTMTTNRPERSFLVGRRWRLLVVGVLALLTSCCPLTGVAFGITAMVLGSSAKRYAGPSGAATAATVLGSLACLISAQLSSSGSSPSE